MKHVIVDTTAMPKAIVYPKHSRLPKRCREHLIKATARQCLKLRQYYNRKAWRPALQIGRYAHAKQYKRVGHALRSRVGRAQRDRAGDRFIQAPSDGKPTPPSPPRMKVASAGGRGFPNASQA
jgi:hypothetical protein